MTSLAKQLQQLQIPGLNKDVTRVHHASILFDKQTAASLDIESIYNIGAAGFEQMVSIEPCFMDYQEQLFTQKAIHLQRVMEDKHFNKKLKKVLNEFLLLLSPYLQLQPAKKCLEWLIRRFEVHRFDLDCLLQCLLPYHETQLFTRIIELINVKDLNGSSWEYLIPKLKAGSALNMKTLVRHCCENTNLLNFICEMAIKSTKLMKKGPRSGLEIIYSFYARVVSGVVASYESGLSDNLIPFLMPMIENGLASGFKHFICATYMILSVLVSNGVLKKKVRTDLVLYTIKSMQIDWYEYGLMCVLSIVLSAKIRPLSKKLLEPILSLDLKSLVNCLVQMQAKYQVENFIKLIIQLPCKHFGHGDVLLMGSLIEELFSSLEINKEVVKECCKDLMNVFIEKPTEDDEDDGNAEEIFRVLKIIATRFSTVFDDCLGDKFTEHKEDKSAVIRLKKLVSNCLAPGKSSIIESTDLPLVVCLNHPEKELRRQAVQQLFELYESGVHGEDEDLFKEAITQRLFDDNPSVVKQVLKHHQAVVNILPKTTIKAIVTKLSERADDTFNLSPFYMKILQDLDDSKVEDQNLFFSVLAQVFTAISTKQSKAILRFFQDEQYSLSHPILSGIKEALLKVKKSKKNSKIVEAYVDLINNVATKFVWERFELLWRYQSRLHYDHILQFISLLILMVNTESGAFKLEKVMGLKLYRPRVRFQSHDFLEQGDKLGHMINIFVTGMKDSEKFQSPLTSMCYAYFLQMLITNLSENRGNEKLRKILFELLVPDATVPKKKDPARVFYVLVKQYFESCFENGDDIRSFAVNVCIDELLNASRVFEKHIKFALNALSMMEIFLDSSKVIEIADDELGLHLALLSFPCQSVRISALDNCVLYYKHFKDDKKSHWNLLLKEIIDRRSEIITDYLYAERMFQALLDISSSKSSKSSNEENAFEFLSKKDDKETKKKSTCLKKITNLLSKWHISITTNILKVMKFIEVDDNLIAKAEEIGIDNGSCKNHALFYEQIILTIMDGRDNQRLSDASANFIIKCLETSNLLVADAVLLKLTNSFYASLDNEHQYDMLKILFKKMKVSNSIETSTYVRRLVKCLPIQTSHICCLLQTFITTTDEAVVNETNRESLKEAVRGLEEILSSIHEQDLQDKHNELVTSLFTVLERSMKIEETEFIKQLSFAILHKITKIERVSSILNFHSFNINIMLDCLKTSTNLQTQENCLLLIASTTTLFPVQTLHSVMHVFSFMGGNLIRLDNEHSFSVIEKTIHTILPAILQIRKEGTRKRISEASVEEIVMEVIQTFVNACPHCPEHRREFILQELLKAVGVREHLSSTMLLMIKKISAEADSSNTGIVTTTTDVPMEDSGDTNYAPITLDFCLHFFSLYDINEQMFTIQQIVTFLTQLSHESSDHRKKRKQQTSTTLIFDAHKEGDTKIRLFTYTVVSFLTLALKSQTLSKIHYLWEESEEQDAGSHLKLTEALIHYADLLNTQSKNTTGGVLNQKFQSKLLTKICHLLDTTLESAPFSSYVSILAGLLQKNEHVLKLKGLELLSKFLQNTDEQIDNEQEEYLLQLLPILNVNLQTKKKADPNTMQLTLFCLRLLVVKLCRNHPQKFLPLVPSTHRMYGNEKTNDMVSINAMLLGAELVFHLKAQVLSDIGDMVQPLLTKLTKCLNDEEKNDALMMTTCLTCLQKMFVAIPKFMSPYIGTVITKISQIEMYLESFGSKDIERIERILRLLKSDIAKKITPRLILPILNELMSSVTIDNVQTLVTVSSMYGECLDLMSSTDINEVFKANHVLLFKALLEKPTLFDVPCIESVEKSTIEAFSKLTLKMTEKSLRHIYAELFVWATSDEALVTRKILTFFRLSISMATTLQGLFLLFVHDTLEKASEILSYLVSGKSNDLNKQVLKCCVDCCAAIFRYDTHGFINKDRFQMVVKPLVEQMETSVYNDETFNEFLNDHLQPCLVNLASAVNDVACWKTLNHQLLVKTKSDKADVRFGVLSIIEKIYDTLGESYMVLIPETIPFLSEVLEDESSEVEQKCRQVIKQIEGITGESMHKYF